MKRRLPKPSFRTVFWTLVGVGLAALLALAFRPGATPWTSPKSAGGR